MTGRWPDVLADIADEAARKKFDATALHALATSGGTSGEVIPQFLAQLEQLRRPNMDERKPILIVLDGLSDWAVDEVRDTVLPRLCWPLLRSAPGSRLRMMISLTDDPLADVRDARPTDWQPIVVGEFGPDEWGRAIEHLRDHWLGSIVKVKPELTKDFRETAESYRPWPYAERLGSLRSLAQVILR